MKKLVSVLITVVLLMGLFVGCSKEEAAKVAGDAGKSEAVSKPEAKAEDKEVAVEAVESNIPEGGYVIGVSNGYIGNGWRTQMINSIEKLGEYYKGQGLVKEVIVQKSL